MVYHVIVNPAGASGKTGKLWKNRLEPVFRESGEAYEVHYSTRECGIGGICRELESRISDKEKLILITVGGDGSVNEALNGITDPSRILFGHIPAGSGNDLVRDMDLPKEPEEIARRILDGRVKRVFDIGELEYADTGETRRFAVSCGIGFDAGICEMAGRSRYKDLLNKIGLGQLIYIVSAFRIVSGQKADAVEIILDEEWMPESADFTAGVKREAGRTDTGEVDGAMDEDAGADGSREEGSAGGGGRRVVRYDHLLLLACMNHRFEGGGFQFAPEARYDDHILDLCIADPPRNSAFYKIFPFAPSGSHVRFREIHMHTGHTIEVKTKIPLWVHTDGEVERQADHIRIRTLPQQLNVLE